MLYYFVHAEIPPWPCANTDYCLSQPWHASDRLSGWHSQGLLHGCRPQIAHHLSAFWGRHWRTWKCPFYPFFSLNFLGTSILAEWSFSVEELFSPSLKKFVLFFFHPCRLISITALWPLHLQTEPYPYGNLGTFHTCSCLGRSVCGLWISYQISIFLVKQWQFSTYTYFSTSSALALSGVITMVFKTWLKFYIFLLLCKIFMM